MPLKEANEAILASLLQDTTLEDTLEEATLEETTPREATSISNRTLLKTIYKFKRQVPLQNFIFQKGPRKDSYSLAEILTVLKNVITSEKLYDDKNPYIILCSEDLEKALDQKACHVTEVLNLVLCQLVKIESPSPRERSPIRTPERTRRSTSIVTNVDDTEDTKYRVKPFFLDVLHSVEGANQDKVIYSRSEAATMLSQYILAKRDTLFDSRNIKLALVEGDLLGKAFGVKAFHRDQVNTFLRSQLIAIRAEETHSINVSTIPDLSTHSEGNDIPLLTDVDSEEESSSDESTVQGDDCAWCAEYAKPKPPHPE